MIALVAGLGLVELFLPGFNILIGKNLSLDLLRDSSLLLSLFLLVVLMAVLSGSYPALFLSSFQPVEAMKGKLKSGQEGKFFRNGLVVFQFSASIVLIICTAVVFEQLNYVSEKDLGFDKENLLVVNHVESVRDGETLVNAALNLPRVTNATLCTSLPPTVWGGDVFTASGMDNKTFSLNFTTSDQRFIPTLNIKIKLGRNFSLDNPGDSSRLILNESAVKKIGWALDESVIGKVVEYPGSTVRFEVIGVVEDFNYWSLQSNIEPMGIFHLKSSEIIGEGAKRHIALRISAKNSAEWQSTISDLEKLWKIHAGETPFEYSFVDASFAEAFKSEKQLGKALTVMASLAILIASMGLLGMIIYALELRTKEIGIRKVSGASTWNILTLISQRYAILILIAFLIGAPLSWWMMKQWLLGFAYRITPSPWLFGAVGLGTLLIAVVISSYHSVKAATMNPVDVLKDE